MGHAADAAVVQPLFVQQSSTHQLRLLPVAAALGSGMNARQIAINCVILQNINEAEAKTQSVVHYLFESGSI